MDNFSQILSIETSCDDTSVALVRAGKKITVTAETTASQIPLHRRFGGVVPEVAARAHAETIVPTITEVFRLAGLNPKNAWKNPPCTAIAATVGPGLVTSLWVGVNTAKMLGWLWHLPVFGVNHIIGHVFSSFINQPQPRFPALALIASGGHSELIYLTAPDKWRKVGATRDDAAGEAFDKFAKTLGRPYPGGPEIARLATTGDPTTINFPRPMLQDKSLDFSFAGLKTAGRLWREKQKKITPQLRADAAASYQAAIVEVLVTKTVRAAAHLQPRTILLGGGVAANDSLRSALANEFDSRLLVPDKKYTGDNAAMIGAAALLAPRRFRSTYQKLVARPDYEL